MGSTHHTGPAHWAVHALLAPFLEAVFVEDVAAPGSLHDLVAPEYVLAYAAQLHGVLYPPQRYVLVESEVELNIVCVHVFFVLSIALFWGTVE